MSFIKIPRGVSDRLRHDGDATTHLYLVRHGQTSANVLQQFAGHYDVALDEIGLAQAAQVGDHMRSVQLDAIVSSPLQRAYVTAENIAQHHGLPIATDDRLREMFFGHAEGLTMAEAIVRFPELKNLDEHPDDLDIGWPGGETRREFHDRTFAVIGEIATTHLDRHVAVVCHGGVIGSIIAQLDGGSLTRSFAEYPIHNCSVTHLEVHAEGTTNHRFNDVAHLEIVNTDISTIRARSESAEVAP